MESTHLYLIGRLRDPAGSEGLRGLFEADRASQDTETLLSSSPLSLTDFEASDLKDPSRALTMVAVDVATGLFVGHVSIHRQTTVAKGTTAHVELVVTHPKFRGRGVSTMLMIAAVHAAQQRWEVVRASTLTSSVGRGTARGMYEKLGYVRRGDTDRFSLPLDNHPWEPMNGARIDSICSFTFTNMLPVGISDTPREVAIMHACGWQGEVLQGWSEDRVIDPIAVCQYKERSPR